MCKYLFPFWRISTSISALFIFISLNLFSQSFEKFPINNLRGGYNGFSSLVDYNNDGQMDIFVTGTDFSIPYKNAVLYTNVEGSKFKESSINNIPRIIYGDYSWGDYDNNGTLDLLYSGTTSGFSEEGITKVYKNVNYGCEFIEISFKFPGVTRGNSKWSDLDNDGLLDVFLVGFDIEGKKTVKVFKNLGDDSFEEIKVPEIDLIGGLRGNGDYDIARLEDLDGDDFPDLIIGLSTQYDHSFNIYKNLGEFKFKKKEINLPQLSSIAMEVGDVNNDGLVDIVFTGSPNAENFTGDGTGDFYVYTNLGDFAFEESFTIVDEGVFFNDIELGDIDNDGFIDAINYGTGPWGTHSEITKIYKNNKDGTFSDFKHDLPKCRGGGVKLEDFDNDNDLDILYFGRINDPYDNEITYIYENNLIKSEIPTEIIINTPCKCDNSLSFSLNSIVDDVQWDFGDVKSGSLNTSKEINPEHFFTENGIFEVSATVTKGTKTEKIIKKVTVGFTSAIRTPVNITTCEGDSNLDYDFELLKNNEILNGLSPDDYTISYYSNYENSEKGQFKLKMPYSINTNSKIYVRVENNFNSNCYYLTDFNIEVFPLPEAKPYEYNVCDDNNDGVAFFNLKNIETEVIENSTDFLVEYYNSSNQLIPIDKIRHYQNLITNNEVIKAKVINLTTKCFTETEISLIVNQLPIANYIENIIACDDNNDGISEYFDTSNIESIVKGGQTNVEISYYDEKGSLLPSPLPNPYINKIRNEETITVRVTSTLTECYNETSLILKTMTQPSINKPSDVYSCDEGNGLSSFDLSNKSSEITGNQTGLKVSYYDSTGNKLSDSGLESYQNIIPWNQVITVKVESEVSNICYTETNFNLIVNKLPHTNEIKETYLLCDLEPSLVLNIGSNYDYYEWIYENSSTISNTHEVSLVNSGNYKLIIGKSTNGVLCKNSFDFKLVRSRLPKIIKVDYNSLSDNNFIEIIAEGDGDFEYSIDGKDFQNSNYFSNVKGGIYQVYVRDRNGCGEDFKEVVIIDYPKFFTPNEDGHNDSWRIEGMSKYPNSKVLIYNRFGKVINELNVNNLYWDGLYKGKKMPSNSYWFKAFFDDKIIFSGYFALKR